MSVRSRKAPPSFDELLLLIPDAHIPFEDGSAMGSVVEAIDRLKPTGVYIKGDFSDAKAVSKHRKNPRYNIKLVDEIVATDTWLDRIDDAAPKGAKKVWVEGNHEKRLTDYLIDRAEELYGLVDYKGLLNLEGRGWRWSDYLDHVKAGDDFYITHDVGHAGKTALTQTLDAYGGASVAIGHTHRAGLILEQTVRGERRFAMCNGWLGSKKAYAEYMHKAKARYWSHGFGLVAIKGKIMTPIHVPIVNGVYVLPSPSR
jgi:hypothetical protein